MWKIGDIEIKPGNISVIPETLTIKKNLLVHPIYINNIFSNTIIPYFVWINIAPTMKIGALFVINFKNYKGKEIGFTNKNSKTYFCLC